MRNKSRRDAGKWRKVAKEMRKAANRVDALCRSLQLGDVVRPSVARTGHLTLRCAVCGKVCYKSRSEAEGAVAQIPDPMNAYYSDRCGFWHLATNRPQNLAKEEE